MNIYATTLIIRKVNFENKKETKFRAVFLPNFRLQYKAQNRMHRFKDVVKSFKVSLILKVIEAKLKTKKLRINELRILINAIFLKKHLITYLTSGMKQE